MRRLGLCVSITFCLLSAAGWAQESRATLGGRVIDPQGAVVPNAEVVVASDDTGVKQQTRTNAQGNWAVQFLIPGRYSFIIAAPGFKKAERKGMTLQTADMKQIDVTLELGAVAETISVTGEAPLIDTTSATSGTVITQEQITEMPSMSRVSTLLATLSPGVIAQDQNQNIAHLWSYNAASQFTVNGGRNNIRSNEFELDGMPNVRTDGKVGFMPPPDAVQEFRVQMNAYDASLGRQAGATVQMAIKNGTARYHGSLYEFNQNNILNANLFQTNLTGAEKPPVHFNEYGGTFGGPVRIPKVYNGKEKTFFFVSFDGTRNRDPRFDIRSVPTELERKGDFSQSFTTQLVSGQRLKYPIQIYDPLTVDSRGFRTQFANNVIPTLRLNPIAQNILKYVPLPNTPSDVTGNATNNFVPNSTRDNKMAVLVMRFDQSWSNSHKSFASLRWYHEDELSGDNFHNASTGAYQTRIPRGLGLDHVWTLSPSKVLDLRWNISRFEDNNRDHGAGFDPSVLGFSKSYISQMENPSFPRINGLFGTIGTGSAGDFTGTSYYTWAATMNHSRGNMMLKYGAEYWVLQAARRAIGNQGQFDFNNSNWTRQQATVGGGTGVGSNMAAFLLGLPNGGNFPRNANGLFSQHFYAFYVQNDWRVTPRLTLNMGLRWDYETPVTERYNRLTSYYDLTALNPISDSAQAAYAKILTSNANNAVVQQLAQMAPASAFKVYGNLQFAGVNGRQRSTFNGDFTEFQPRIGFAYRLRPHTVIRGGVGKFVQASYETGWQNGYSRSTSFIATQDNYLTPYDTLSNPFQGGILAPTGSSLGPLTNLGQGVNSYNQDPGRMHSWEYSLHLQHEYKSWLLEIGYTHNKTYGIYWGFNQNLPSYEVWKQLRSPRFDASGRPNDKLLWDELIPNPFYQLPGVTGSLVSNQNISFNQFLRPVKILGDITVDDNPWGKNQYDAMLLKIEHRFKRGFSIINSFTWSKLFEDSSFWGPEVAGRVAEHKLGGEDRPFRLSIAPIWDFPIGRGKKVWGTMPKALDQVLGGWELAGQFHIQSGVPVAFSDSFFDGQNFSLPRDQQGLDRWFDTTHFLRFPDRNCDAQCLAAYPAWSGIQNMPGYTYKPAANDTIKNGVYQDFATFVRRYPTRWSIVRASRTNELNLGLYKNFKIRERLKIQYRFETFNTFNHPRFGAPNADPASSSFGRVTPTEQNNARLVQMALKVNF
ncbi:MAG: TonB-dependent receptor [Acidobacteria bacterium]|nr:TonB-dependent receptor [Acidobacteriota bacterium]